MGQRRLLRFLKVLEQGPRRGNGQVHARHAKAGEVAGAELSGEQTFGYFAIEVPRRAKHAPPTPTLERIGDSLVQACQGRVAFRDQQLHRLEARQFCGQRLKTVRFADREASAGQVDAGKTGEGRSALAGTAARTCGHPQGNHERVAVRFKQSVVGDSAGRDHPYHRAFHGAFRFGRVADLFADGHAFALADQPCQIRFERYHRYPRHGDGRPTRVPARGQRDVQQARGLARVLEEQLVEIAHAVEQQDIRMLRLQAQVLLHHRSVAAGIGASGGRHRNRVTGLWGERREEV